MTETLSWKRPHLDYAHRATIMELRRTVIANRDRYAIIRDNLERGEQATDEMEAILNKRLARGEM